MIILFHWCLPEDSYSAFRNKTRECRAVEQIVVCTVSIPMKAIFEIRPSNVHPMDSGLWARKFLPRNFEIET